MKSDGAVLVVVILAIAAVIVALALNSSRKARERAEGNAKMWRQRETTIQNVLETTQDTLRATRSELQKLNATHQSLTGILEETSTFYPSLAHAIADFRALEHEQIARYLAIKPRPARSAAEAIKEAAKARKEAERRFKILQYQLSYYETAFPWLVDFSGRSSADLLAEYQERKLAEVDAGNVDDPVRRWLDDDEFRRLSSSEKSDLALNRWRESRKTNWEIGREYERAIGHEFEGHGFEIDYFGALKGFEDMGRDLIATKDGITYLIQCKYWSDHKLIHEKHIFQLIGTGLEYACQRLNVPIQGLHLRTVGIVPLLITSTRLSDTARNAAKLIDVEFREQYALPPYPQVKCNINGKTGEKISHLPFDQQYDTTRIDIARGETYVATAAEAERLGFRRALRHRATSSAA